MKKEKKAGERDMKRLKGIKSEREQEEGREQINKRKREG